jgi:hypothetical protein
MACTVIPTKIPTIDKTAIPTNKYQRYQPRGGGMIPIPEKWLVYDWYTTLIIFLSESISLSYSFLVRNLVEDPKLPTRLGQGGVAGFN